MSRKTFRMLSAGAIQFTLRKFCFWQCIVNNRKFKMQRRRESKKCNSLTRQNNNFARASLFFVHSFPSLHDYHVKMPNFTFCGGRKQAMKLQLDMVDRNYSPRRVRMHLTFDDREWKNVNSLFMRRFRGCRLSWHLNLPNIHEGVIDASVNTCCKLKFVFLEKCL